MARFKTGSHFFKVIVLIITTSFYFTNKNSIFTFFKNRFCFLQFLSVHLRSFAAVSVGLTCMTGFTLTAGLNEEVAA